MFPDPSISQENLSTVLDSMDDGLWISFSPYVNIPDSELLNISRQSSSDSHRLSQAISYLISTHPSLSWRLIANSLYQMRRDSCHRALDHLQQLYPTGNVYYLPPTHGENLVAGAYPRGFFGNCRSVSCCCDWLKLTFDLCILHASAFFSFVFFNVFWSQCVQHL